MNAITNFSNKFYEELGKNAPRVDVRQTVLTGPVDANGRADFLQAGTGLQVVTKNLSTTPLVLTFGDGFSSFGQRDVTVQNNQPLSWDSLPASEAEVFLYVDLLADGTFQTGHTLLEPVYAQARPSTPGTGQAFYPTSHGHKMEVFDGSVWNEVLRIFVGECSTDATTVTSVESYLYGIGRGNEAPIGSGQKWVSVGDKTVNTTYTNEFGRTIKVHVVGFVKSTNSFLLFVDGLEIARVRWDSSSNMHGTVIGEVPAGSFYEIVSSGANIVAWRELR